MLLMLLPDTDNAAFQMNCILPVIAGVFNDVLCWTHSVYSLSQWKCSGRISHCFYCIKSYVLYVLYIQCCAGSSWQPVNTPCSWSGVISCLFHAWSPEDRPLCPTRTEKQKVLSNLGDIQHCFDILNDCGISETHLYYMYFSAKIQ